MILYEPGEPPLFESEGVDLDQSDPGVRSRTQSLLALLLLLLLFGGDRPVGVASCVEGSTATVDKGRRPDLDNLFGDKLDTRSGVRVPLRRVVVAVVDGSSKVSSSEKSVEPSSCEMCQSMLTFSNIVFLRWRACISCKKM